MNNEQYRKPQRVARTSMTMPYVVGFVLSVAMTLVAYLAVSRHELSRTVTIVTITGLAVAQFLTQMIFFLHLGREAKPRWRFILLLFALLVVVIVVGGSLWIMNNLNYNMMQSQQQTTQYLNSQDGL
jgi:cytochrome o ubiquinol oxidase subunit IV